MKYIIRAEIEDEKWNACVSNSKNSLVYGATWFLDEIAPVWDAIVWEKDGEYVSVLPIPWKKKAGIKYVYPPFFAQQLGVFSLFEDAVEKTNEAFEFLGQKFRFIEQYFNYSCTKNGQRANYILNLDKSISDIRKGYSSNHRRNLAKFEKTTSEIKEEVEVADIINLFRRDKGAKIKTLKESDYSVFKALCITAKNNSVLKTLGVFEEKKMITGAVFFQFNNRLIFIFSGNSSKGKEVAGLFKLLDYMIEKNSDSAVIIDFEGSVNEGLARFYKGFGAENQSYTLYKKNRLPMILKWIKK